MKIYDYNGRKNLCGNRVKEARARLNITQADLAAQNASGSRAVRPLKKQKSAR